MLTVPTAVLALQSAEQSPLAAISLPLMLLAIFYFVLIQPMRSRQKKLDELIKGLKSGDKILLNPGIFATVVAVEEHSLTVKIDEKTRIRVLKTAVAGLQGQAPEMESK